MKVDDANLISSSLAASPPQASSAVARDAAARKAATAEGNSGDRVQLSNLTGRLGQVLAGQSQERTRRIDALTRDYQTGKYAPNALESSRALVQETLGATAGEKSPGLAP